MTNQEQTPRKFVESEDDFTDIREGDIYVNNFEIEKVVTASRLEEGITIFETLTQDSVGTYWKQRYRTLRSKKGSPLLIDTRIVL